MNKPAQTLLEQNPPASRADETRNTSLFLKAFLPTVAMLAVLSLCFKINVPFEFTGLLSCAFLLWLITETMGWKSDTASGREFSSTTIISSRDSK